MWSVLVFVFLFVISASFSQETTFCKCVNSYLCRKNGTIITDGGGEFIITERIKETCRCNCPNDLVCCRLESGDMSIDPAQPGSKCGFRNPDGTGFKIGANGEGANFGEFPWMMGILTESGGYRCGGSLIHPSVVLTAAHCVVSKSTYIVRAGEWDSSNTKEILKHQDRTVSSKKIHEDYIPGIYHNDIALLFLNEPFKLDSHINVTCLPPSNASFENVRCVATGWGKDKFGSTGKYDPLLKKIELPLVQRNTCQENLRATRLRRYFYLHPSFLCAGGEKDKDACIGDGGGPLVCPINGQENKYYQIGVVSWGIECGQENVPAVYSNIPFLRQWIDKQMQDKNLDISVYQY